MPSPRLNDVEIAEIRALAASGMSRHDIACRFDISVQHVGRIVRGAARAPLASLAATQGSTVSAVDVFLAGLDLDPRSMVLAEAARTLAGKLDQLRESSAAAAASAVPGVARALVDVVEELRGASAEPDAIDDLRRRREVRRLEELRA